MMESLLLVTRHRASEQRFGGYFDDMFDLFVGSGPLRLGKSEETLDDFKSDLLSIMCCSLDEGGGKTAVDDLAFAVKSENAEIRMPSGRFA